MRKRLLLMTLALLLPLAAAACTRPAAPTATAAPESPASIQVVGYSVFAGDNEVQPLKPVSLADAVPAVTLRFPMEMDRAKTEAALTHNGLPAASRFIWTDGRTLRIELPEDPVVRIADAATGVDVRTIADHMLIGWLPTGDLLGYGLPSLGEGLCHRQDVRPLYAGHPPLGNAGPALSRKVKKGP